MQVNQADADVAYEIFYRHCRLFKALQLNIFEPDVRMKPARLGSHDLVACSTDFQPGLVSIELEVQRAMNIKEAKKSALEKFKALSSQGGFQRLLVVCTAIKQASGSSEWQETQMKAEIWNGSCWRKQAQTSSDLPPQQAKKKPTKQILDSLIWWKAEDEHGKVAKVSQFASKLGYKSGHELNKQVKVWNKLLKSKSIPGRLRKRKLLPTPGKATTGSIPWIGTRPTLKSLYGLL